MRMKKLRISYHRPTQFESFMRLLDEGIVLAKDLALLLMHCCGRYNRVIFEYIASWTMFILRISSHVITLCQALFIVPLHIIVKVGLQLFLLPVNLPLRLLLGTSLKNILLHATSRPDIYVFITIAQYFLSLGVYGVLIGAICGSFLSVMNFIWRIPDIYIEVPIRFWKYIPSPPMWLRSRLLFQDSPSTQFGGKDTQSNRMAQASPPLTPSSQPSERLQSLLKSELATPKLTPGFSTPKHPSVSKENILKVASVLPSNFFQQDQSKEKLYGKNEQCPSRNRSQISSEDSSVEFTNLWDKVEDSPITLRTEDGFSTLLRRRNLPELGVKEKFGE